MTDASWLLAVLFTGLGTYALRVAPFVWQPLFALGKRHARFLTCVSFAIAAGIVAKAVFIRHDGLVIDGMTLLQIIAIAFAVGMHRVTRNLPVALFSGVLFAVLLKLVIWS